MDEKSDFPVAVCHSDMDSDAVDRDIEADAKHRASAIAAALNEVGFDWQPPTKKS